MEDREFYWSLCLEPSAGFMGQVSRSTPCQDIGNIPCSDGEKAAEGRTPAPCPPLCLHGVRGGRRSTKGTSKPKEGTEDNDLCLSNTRALPPEKEQLI